MKKKETNDPVIPLFDHYNVAFSGCDKFNWTMHGKNWPFTRRGDFRVGSDYLITAFLINCYHLWIDAGPLSEGRVNVGWMEFCVELAEEIVSGIREYETQV